MPKKNNILSSEEMERFRRDVEKAHEDGYVFMPVNEFFDGNVPDNIPGWEDVLNASLYGTAQSGTTLRPGQGCGIFASSGIEVKVSDAGTPDLGYMEWGIGNRLPNIIALLCSLLPYTATGQKFNTDMSSGLGPQPKYRYSRYVQGSGVKTEEVDFHAAGKLIDGELSEARNRLAKHYRYCRENGIALSDTEVASEESKVNKDIERQLLRGIADHEQAYGKWKTTDAELRDFMTRNNFDLILLQMFGDMCMFNICFPEIILSRGTFNSDAGRFERTETSLWKPHVTSITYRPAHTCRLERMNEDGKINYVYVSNRWLDQSVSATDKIDAVRALDPQRPVSDLRYHVRNTRQKGKTIPDSGRPTRFILPSFYPTVGRPYYPQPAWHSIFGGDIYTYISTIISDRATRKRNGKSFGRILYIHTEYLSKLAIQRKLMTNEEKENMKNQIVEKVNEFFLKENNNGKPLVSATFTGNDGKDRDAFRIVELPYNNKNTTDANKTELEELASIVFFSMGIWPELVGSIPGKGGGVGGTYLREMHQLKQLMMAPTQQIVLKVLETASTFNGWDEHLVWRIRQMTLTTLDRNKNGMEETKA